MTKNHDNRVVPHANRAPHFPSGEDDDRHGTKGSNQQSLMHHGDDDIGMQQSQCGHTNKGAQETAPGLSKGRESSRKWFRLTQENLEGDFARQDMCLKAKLVKIKH